MLDKIQSFNSLVDLIESVSENKEIAKKFVKDNMDIFQYHNLNYILNNARAIKGLILIKDLPVSIMVFLNELSNYQSNHYGSYDDSNLYKAYFELPDIIRKRSQPRREEMSQIYRGDNQKSEKNILSFAVGEYAKENAKNWGNEVYPLSDLKTYKAILDLTKLRTALERTFGKKKSNTLTSFFEFGDDENEVLVFGGIWK